MNNKKLRVAHIHSDSKFINGVSGFEGDFFQNDTLIIKTHNNYSGKYAENAQYFDVSLEDANNIIRICSNYDLVIVWDLDNIKSYIVNRLPERAKIVWFFFGYELYSKKPDLFLSNKTKNIIKRNIFISTIQNFKKIIYNIDIIKSFAKKKHNPFLYEFEKAVERINYLLCLCKEEYNYLISLGFKLPDLVQRAINIPLKEFELSNFSQKKDTIIVGNSRSIYNNHIDIFEIILSSKNFERYKYLIPFSYGNSNKQYIKALKELVKKYDNIEFLNVFLKRDEYRKLFESASASIFNSYRQMAGGNIYISLRNGLKTYLNQKNSLYDRFVNEGLKVFTIDDFEKDLENDNLKLSLSDALYNFQKIDDLSKKYSVEDFQKTLYNKMIESKI